MRFPAAPKHELGPELYKLARERFLSGVPIRQIALDHGMSPWDVRDYLRWAASEFEIERRTRTDLVLASIMRSMKIILDQAEEAAKAGEISKVGQLARQVEELRQLYSAMIQEDRRLLAERRRVLDSRRPDADANAEKGFLDDVISGNGENDGGGRKAAKDRTLAARRRKVHPRPVESEDQGSDDRPPNHAGLSSAERLLIARERTTG